MTEKLSLTELQLIIRDSLYLTLPDFYWVIAEISELKENHTGHCYLELIEKDPDEKNVRSRAKAIIWSKRYGFIKSLFKNITGVSLTEGQKVLIKAKIEYHELYGLSLIITDIDPAFTIGEMAMKRQAIIQKLEEEGVFLMNKELDFPIVPQRIAVISSKAAAGYSDFINHLRENSFGYVFHTTLVDSVMQGIETENSVIGALDRIAENSEQFDIVVIIRGGGSQSDLSWFDNYTIAYYVTQFPIPVITGIGHDKDMSVTDMVAYNSLKTPTAVADYLIECMSLTENHLQELSNAIKTASRIIIEKNKNMIETSGIKLLPLARIMLSDLKEKINEKVVRIIHTGKEYTYKARHISADQKFRLMSATRMSTKTNNSLIERVRQKLISGTQNLVRQEYTKMEGYENKLNILNPEKVLLRGYTITSINGRILKKRRTLKNDDVINTEFSDGSVTSVIVGWRGD
jgi:exodeoxyribonuclease VII large subunit